MISVPLHQQKTYKSECKYAKYVHVKCIYRIRRHVVTLWKCYGALQIVVLLLNIVIINHYVVIGLRCVLETYKRITVL